MTRERVAACLRNVPLLFSLVLPLLSGGCSADRSPGSAAVSGAEDVAAGGVGAAFAPHPNLVVERDLEIPMRDGVVLRADLFRPAGDGRYPVLLYRTPYGKEGLLEDWELTLSRGPRFGYAVVVQDVRGRYRSEGTFRAYHQEGEDGHDTIEWVARQPWSNGRVGTFGLSYPGAVQWLAAMETPPSLKAIFPAMTFATGRHFFHHGGALDHAWIPWIETNIAPDERRRRGLAGPKTYREARARWLEKKWEWEGTMPLTGLPLLKKIAPWYYEWLRHPDDGPFWDFVDVQAAHERITVPALNFSGWFDNNYGPLGAIANFNGMRERAATEEARSGQKLILGPWDHGDPHEYETRVGELDFGINATFDYFGTILRWHDRWLKGIRNDVDDWPPVQIFVMGENAWRAEEEWPPARARYEPYYLRSAGGANRVGGDGRITTAPPPAGEPPDRYVYDPEKPVRYENFESSGPFDHAPIQEREDVLVYTSAPLERDLEVTGPVTADLWIASSAVDTDFGITLLDVHPDGRAFNVMPNEAGYLRVRYRDSESSPTFITPGEPTAIRIGNMVTSNLFRKGHRIRVLITSSRFPVFDRNPNTGDNPAEAVRMEPAQQTVFHDDARPSRITLPIIARGDDGGS